MAADRTGVRDAIGLARLVRLCLLAVCSGCVAGVSSFVFLELLDRVTRARVRHGWLVWLLPVAGLLVGVVYHRLAGRAAGGTGLVIREARFLRDGVPLRMAPLILGGTLVGHLVGASVGREGTALQLSGALTDGLAQRLRIAVVDRRVLLPAALAGGFGAVFGVPAAGVVFAVTIASAWQPVVVVTCVIAAVVGDAVVGGLGHRHAVLPQVSRVPWGVGLALRLVVVGVLCGVAARVFVVATSSLRRLMARFVERPWLRPVVGGVATLALMGMVGREYLGLSLPLVGRAFADGSHPWTAPLLKLVFTAVALGTGFVGGEVTPLFIIGASTGAWVAAATNAAAPHAGATLVVLAACGFVSVFAAASGATAAGVVMAVELFGWRAAVPAAVVGVVARVVAGRPALYVSRREIASRPAAAPTPSR